MISQVFLPIFLLYLQPHLTDAQQSSIRSEFDLNNFSGVLKRGDNVKLVHQLKKHLMYLGYLDPNNLRSGNNFDKHLEHAIKKYQGFHGLNPTGVVDIATVTSIRKPRPGVPYFFSPQTQFKSLYTLFEDHSRWWRVILKYHMDEITVKKAYRPPITQALREWQAVTGFQFHYTENIAGADIKISFETGYHGCEEPFSPSGLASAHSSNPPHGIVHFNAERRWASDGDTSAYDIKTIALHELGHALGLDHSTDEDALMYPIIRVGERKLIHRDDINGINALYGWNYPS